MELSCLFTTSRSAALKLFDGGKYNTLKPYRITVNGAFYAETDRVITSLYDLKPDTEYDVCVFDGDEKIASVTIRTLEESVSLNVRRFGAVGDGEHDDTAAIQAAINCCPANGRVRIPAGDYLVTPLFLKSHITIEIQQGATLKLCTDRNRFPILPGVTFTKDEDYLLGTWEGNPLDAYASFITGIEVEAVRIIGPGTLDGQAPIGDWWVTPKVRRGAWRPRMMFLCRCKNITVQGLSVCGSPSWNLHPYFSDDLTFADLNITAPANSPNTDGFDPESCKHVLFTGVHFSVGDDCIAVKSGKIYMGQKYGVPCEDIDICHCLMEKGHGGLTTGSECAGGIINVRVRYCLMRNTDRGLRVKNRRGRGQGAVADRILFEHVDMEHVSAPFVINSLYYCDPDGKSDYVQCREPLPVDERTPSFGSVTFKQVRAENCGACAGYFLGLPEKPIDTILLEDCSFTFDPDAKPMLPAMALGVEICHNQGLIVYYADKVILRNVSMNGQKGDKLTAVSVNTIDWEDEA